MMPFQFFCAHVWCLSLTMWWMVTKLVNITLISLGLMVDVCSKCMAWPTAPADTIAAPWQDRDDTILRLRAAVASRFAGKVGNGSA